MVDDVNAEPSVSVVAAGGGVPAAEYAGLHPEADAETLIEWAENGRLPAQACDMSSDGWRFNADMPWPQIKQQHTRGRIWLRNARQRTMAVTGGWADQPANDGARRVLVAWCLQAEPSPERATRDSFVSWCSHSHDTPEAVARAWSVISRWYEFLAVEAGVVHSSPCRGTRVAVVCDDHLADIGEPTTAETL